MVAFSLRHASNSHVKTLYTHSVYSLMRLVIMWLVFLAGIKLAVIV